MSRDVNRVIRSWRRHGGYKGTKSYCQVPYTHNQLLYTLDVEIHSRSYNRSADIMGKSLTKVIYKPDSQSTDEYIVIVNPEEVSSHPSLLVIHLILLCFYRSLRSGVQEVSYFSWIRVDLSIDLSVCSSDT